MSFKKMVYLSVGCIGLALGAVGAAVPILPSFPFLMLAACCFGKSSERLHRWFVGTKLYKDNLESFVSGNGMTWKAKIRLMVVITITMFIGFMMMGKVPIGRIVLAGVWIFHILYFIFGIPKASETP